MMPKTITGFVVLMGAMTCGVCAAQTPATAGAPVASSSTPSDAVPPRTLPSHPEPQSAESTPTASSKAYGGAYTGYRRVVSNGQERYCRNDVATGSHTERKAVCLTEAQVRIERLKAEQFMLDMQRRAGSERQLTYIYGNNAGMSPSAR